MTRCWRLNGFQWRSASSVLVSGAIAIFGDCVLAQITPDGTLPNNSIVTPQGKTSIISGGTQAGGNLFHSFEKFSVPTGGAAYFNNALNIQNIISRVTGESISNIDGLLRANASVNLFLLNPNGIIFGPNASLSIGGSFLGSTASAINFADGTQFSATAPQTKPLLIVSVPLGLQFGNNPENIQVQGNGQGLRTTSDLIDTTIGLQVQPNQTLALVGGNVALEGGTLKTAGGRIELGSVAGYGLVSLTPIDKGLALGYSRVPTFRDIQLSSGAAVDASGEGGGDIQVQGRRITLTDSSEIEVSTLGAQPGGSLNVAASESVELIGTTADGQFASGLFTQVYEGATGAGGNLTVETGRLSVSDGAQVSASTSGPGSAGILTVRASESVEVIGESANGRRSALDTTAQPGATGAGGNLTVETGRLIVEDGAYIFAGTFGSGSSGTLEVRASDSVELIGTTADGQFASGLFTTAEPGATGAGGNLTVETGRLIVRDEAQVTAGTAGSGKSGDLTVRAKESVELIAGGDLLTSVFEGATGDGGNLTVETGRFIANEAGAITVTDGSGKSGNLTVRAKESVELNGGVLAVSSWGSGDAGSLEVVADSIRLDNQAVLRADTTAGQGNIFLNSGDLVLRRESFITTDATGTAEGGNITIDTDILAALENSDIRANAEQALGGQVRIDAQGIFGTEFREIETSESEITASSRLGPQFSGTVEINTPDVDPSQGLVALPVELVDVSELIASGCGASRRQGESKFIVTGRGGLPYRPIDASISPYPTGTVRSIPSSGPSSDSQKSEVSGSDSSTNPTATGPAPIVEARGWVINGKGEVMLTAIAPNVTPHSPWIPSATCHTSETSS